MYKSKHQPCSRSQIINWINRTLNINETKIENLGTGVVYCMLINHFHPNTIHAAKITQNPRSHHDYRGNLRRVQEGLASLDLKHINFDVFKVSDMTYHENWNLVNKFYKQFGGSQKEKSVNSESRWHSKPNENKIEAPFSQNMMMINPLSTPMKIPKLPEEKGNIRWQTTNTIEEIKRIVVGQGVPDRLKVDQLRNLLGLKDDQGAESEGELRDLLSDYKKKEIIQID